MKKGAFWLITPEVSLWHSGDDGVAGICGKLVRMVVDQETL